MNEDTLERLPPDEIERRSFAIIKSELGSTGLSIDEEAALHRVIHTTADFDYAQNLTFTHDAARIGIEALRRGATIITDTNMAKAGVSKPGLAKLGGRVECFMADEDVAEAAKRNGTTRALAAVDKAAATQGELIFAVGNAPTALLRICELLREGSIRPALVIGVPVGFVHVVESKLRLLEMDTPSIVARGRKGGSNVAAAICNALIYRATGRDLLADNK